MALASLPSPTDSLQLQTFRQRSDLLNDLDDNTIRWLAYCANLINFAEKEKIVDNRGSGESKTLFTRSVKNAIARDPDNYTKFVNVLRKEPTLKNIALSLSDGRGVVPRKRTIKQNCFGRNTSFFSNTTTFVPFPSSNQSRW